MGNADENVEVVASHYLKAYRAAPQALDAVKIKAKAVQMLIRASHRALSLGASDKAQAYRRDALAIVSEFGEPEADKV